MHRPVHAVIAIAMMTVTSTAAFASNQWYVSNQGVDSPTGGSSTAPWKSIGYALQQLQVQGRADAGDTINVAQGTYFESALDTTGFIVTITGAQDLSGNPATVIDAQAQSNPPRPIFAMEDRFTPLSIDPKTTLNFLVLKNGTGLYFPNAVVPFTQGGAVYVGSRSHCDINHCDFLNNSANTGGALSYEGDQNGVGYWGPSKGTVSNCNFQNNRALETSPSSDDSGTGGAVLSSLGDTHFKNCFFSHNSAEISGQSGLGGGGALVLDGGIRYEPNLQSYYALFPTVIDCRFENNTTEGMGGAIFWGSIQPTISGCTITNNSARGLDGFGCDQDPAIKRGGGGIYCDDAGLIENCSIEGNQATESAGGGIYAYNLWDNDVLRLPHIVNTNITNNSALQAGGGLFTSNPPITDAESPFQGNPPIEITNCNISSNTADTGNGGGIYFGRNVQALVRNSAIVNNQSTTGSGGGVLMWHSSGGTFDCVVVKNNRAVGDPQVSRGGGFALYGGQFSGDDGCYKDDGGVLVTMKNVLIENNNTNGSGGGMALIGNANCTIQTGNVNCTVDPGNANSTFLNNRAQGDGGGFYLANTNALAPLRGPYLIATGVCTLNNEATAGRGGGIFVGENTTARFQNSQLNDNSCLVDNTCPAHPQGGAIYAESGGSFHGSGVPICGNSKPAGTGCPPVVTQQVGGCLACVTLDAGSCYANNCVPSNPPRCTGCQNCRRFGYQRRRGR